MRVHDGFIPCDQADAVIAADVGALRRAPTPGPDRYSALHNLAIALYSRYRCTRDFQDVDAAVRHLRGALRLLPARHPDRAVAEGNLSMFLVARRGPGDLDEAAVAGRRALAQTPAHDPGYPQMLSQVAQVEYELFQQDAEPGRIDEAIDLLERATQLRALGSAGAAEVHLNQAVIRLARQQSLGTHPEDLDAALATLAAIATAPPPQRAPGLMNAVHSNLAQAYNLRFLRDGDDGDRARSAAWQEELQRSGDPALAALTTALAQDNVATDAMMMYLRTGRLAELDRAVQAEEAALAAVDSANPARPALLGNLGICLLLRHRARHGVTATSSGDLVEGLHCAREAVELGGEGVYSAASAGILGSLVLQQAAQDPDALAQLSFAEQMFRRAGSAMPPGDPQRQAIESQLAQCRALRAVHQQDLTELETAIDDLTRALALLPPGSPLRPGALGVQADLRLAAAVLSAGDDRRVDRAVEAARGAVAAAEQISAATAFTTARHWGDTMWRLGRLRSAGEAYAVALRLLHSLSRAQLVFQDKDVALGQAADVTERAAIALAYTGRPADAALAVELGRAVVLSEVLGVEQAQVLDVAARLRPDLVDAHRQAAQRLSNLQRQALAGGADRAELASARKDLDASLLALEDLLGVELLRPPDLSSLRQALAVTGLPVVYVVAGELGGVALIAGPDGSVRGVPLARLTTARVAELSEQFLTAATTEGGELTQDGEWAEEDEQAALATTGMWADAMAEITAGLAEQPRAVLVPVGGLGALPLHAAGFRTTDGCWRFADERTTYVYAPNARVMAVATHRAEHRTGQNVLLIAEPRTDLQLRPLPAAIEECRLVGRHFPADQVLAVLTAAAADRAAVLRYLPDAALVHFAGHALVDPADALDSALVLAGPDRLSLRDVLMTDLPSTRLVVLSACSTAVMGQRLRDEVVSFPSALVQAGVAGVVGALWPVDDVAGALLLARFHDLRRSGRPGGEALAGAQRWLRQATNRQLAEAFPQVDLDAPEDPGELAGWLDQQDFAAPLWWAPFVYVGA